MTAELFKFERCLQKGLHEKLLLIVGNAMFEDLGFPWVDNVICGISMIHYCSRGLDHAPPRGSFKSSCVWRNISNTKDSVSSGYPNTEKIESWKYDAQRSIFDQTRGVWIGDETLSRVCDISSQPKQKLKGKRRSKIVKFYAN